MGKTWFCAPSILLFIVRVRVRVRLLFIACLSYVGKEQTFCKICHATLPQTSTKPLLSIYYSPLHTTLSLFLSRVKLCYGVVATVTFTSHFTRCKSRRSVHLQCFASLCDTRAVFDVLCTSDHAWQDTSHDLSCAKQVFLWFLWRRKKYCRLCLSFACSTCFDLNRHFDSARCSCIAWCTDVRIDGLEEERGWIHLNPFLSSPQNLSPNLYL